MTTPPLPGRYVGAEAQPDDGEPFEEKVARLIAQWREQQAEAQKLDAAIETNLKALGFEEWRTGNDSSWTGRRNSRFRSCSGSPELPP